MSKKKQLLLICIFLAAATLIAFWQVNHCDFINYDDNLYVTENIHIQDGITMRGNSMGIHDLLCRILASPDVDIPHAGCSALRVESAVASSDESLLPHCKYAIALFRSSPDDESALAERLCGGFVCASPPPRGVRRLGGRAKDVLSTFFWMLTMGAYGYYVERPGLQRYLAVLVFFALGLMAKPMLVTLPFVLLLLDYWPLKRFGKRNRLRKSGRSK